MTRINDPRPNPPPGPIPRKNDAKPRMSRQKRERMSDDARYLVSRDDYLRNNPQCVWCVRQADYVHHICGASSRRASLTNQDTWLAVCGTCHEVISAMPTRLQILIKQLSVGDTCERLGKLTKGF